MFETAEVVVVGAGPAGSATAALLARRGRRVVLLDRASFPRPKACAEYASPGTVAVLKRLGYSVGTGRRLRGMQLIAPNGAHYLLEYRRSDAEPAGESLAIERAELDAGLLELARQSGTDVRESHRAEQLLVADGAVRGVVARDASGHRVEVHAQLVVGADGLNSMVVRALDLRRRVVWPSRMGLVAHLRGVNWPEDYGQMWVGPGSYIGAAPVGRELVTVALVTDVPKRHLGSAVKLLDVELRQFPALRTRLLDGVLADRVRGIAPLAHAVSRTCGRGFILVGDSAGFFDPFTGEGLFRALRGAELAAEAVDRTTSGDRSALAAYQTMRQRTFGAKERLAMLIQVFVRSPGLMNYAVARLRKRPHLARQLGLVLGDLAPAETAWRAAFLWKLLGA